VIETLPPQLLVHLKRFRYDPTSRRRQKLDTTVLFPERLNACELLQDRKGEENEHYILTAVMLHTGTAMGGHYRVYVRSEPASVTNHTRWLDCNDTSVTEVCEEEASRLFWFGANDMHELGIDPSTKRNLLYGNAYMLVYVKETEVYKTSSSSMPANIRCQIEQENEEIFFLRRLKEIQNRLVELRVFSCTQDDVKGIGEERCVATDSDTLASGSSATNKMAACKSHVFYLPSSSTLKQALVHVWNHENANYDSGCQEMAIPLKNTRLRCYNDVTRKLGETYGGRESQTLGELGLAPAATMYFETRLDKDEPFVEFNPKAMKIQVRVCGLSNVASTACVDERPPNIDDMIEGFSTFVITVPGEDAATVGALRKEAASAVGVCTDEKHYTDHTDHVRHSRVILIQVSDRSVDELANDDLELKHDLGIWPGDEITVEIIPETAPEDYVSRVLPALRRKHSEISVCFNDPTREKGPDAGANADADSNTNSHMYDVSVAVSATMKLSEVKQVVAATLKLSFDSFYFKRNASAPQLKEEKKTLAELGIVDQSILHVQLGVGCKPGEHMIRLEKIESTGDVTGNMSTSYLGELPVHEKLSIFKLKEKIVAQWKIFSALDVAGKQPLSAHHLRLRDGKSAQLSGPLRDDRIVSRCLLGLMDGRRVVLQVLPEPEIIGPDDLILCVRVCDYARKVISKPIDLAVPKSTTIAGLYILVLQKFPHMNLEPKVDLDLVASEVSMEAKTHSDPVLTSSDPAIERNTGPHAEGFAVGSKAEGGIPESNIVAEESLMFPPESRIIEIAKGYSTGPPLTVKSSLKLKWNDPSVLRSGDAPIDRPPLTMRDGSVLVVRSIEDFNKARDAARARREADGALQQSRPISRGSGLAGARARAAVGRQPVGRMHAQERGLKIQGSTYTDGPGTEEGNDANASDAYTPPKPPGKEVWLLDTNKESAAGGIDRVVSSVHPL
jgi:hypothetical protein